MRVNILRVLDHSSAKALRDAAATLRAVVLFATPLVAAAGALYVVWNRDAPSAVVAVTLGMSVLVALIATCCAWKMSVLSRPENHFVLERFESTLSVERVAGHHRYTLTRDFTARPKVRGLKLFPQTWFWTGQSSRARELESLYPGHVIFDGERPENDRLVHFWTYLGRDLLKGEPVSIGAVLTMEDDILPMRQFFTEGGRGFKSELTKLTLRFQKEIDPSLVEAASWPRRHDDQTPRSSLPVARSVRADGSVEYVVTLVKPRRRTRHGFWWS